MRGAGAGAVRAAAAGIAATLVDICALATLVERFALPVAAAAFASASLGATVSFALARRWVFADRSPLCLGQVLLFAAVAATSALFLAATVHVLSVYLGLAYLAAKALGAAVVFVCFSYPVQSRVVFVVANPQGRSQWT